MSLLHFIACKIVNKGKVEFDKNCPPDYVGRRKKNSIFRAEKSKGRENSKRRLCRGTSFKRGQLDGQGMDVYSWRRFCRRITCGKTGIYGICCKQA